jgi:hypothetical protein
VLLLIGFSPGQSFKDVATASAVFVFAATAISFSVPWFLFSVYDLFRNSLNAERIAASILEEIIQQDISNLEDLLLGRHVKPSSDLGKKITVIVNSKKYI